MDLPRTKEKNMTKTIQHEKYGTIVYEENIWTGKQVVKVNGVELKKEKRKLFVGAFENGVINITLKGNSLTGLKLSINNGNEILVIESMKWYDIALSVIIASVIIALGNVHAVVKVVPIVGGAIGGGIAGLVAGINLAIIKFQKKIWVKILITLLAFGVAFGLCTMVGAIIVSLDTKR